MRLLQHLSAGLLLAVLVGCAAAPSVNKTIDHGPTWLVRLDTHAWPSPTARYEHPVDMSDAEWHAVLEHVAVRRGDDAGAPEPLLSSSSLVCLVPGVREAFHRAKETEWVAFAVIDSKPTAQVVTSGGMFRKEGRLYVLVANYRMPNPYGDAGAVDPLLAEPLRPRTIDDRTLLFEPAQFMDSGASAPTPERFRFPLLSVAIDHERLIGARAQWPTLLPPRASRAASPLPTGC